jgi:hypothetical protein
MGSHSGGLRVESVEDQWLQRAFRLAHLFHQSREVAFDIALRAVNDLSAQTIKLRNKLDSSRRKDGTGPAGSIKKLTLSGPRLLQYLLYLESDITERDQERRRDTALTKSILTLRFVKFIVRSAWRNPCLHMTVGLMRVVHKYGTEQLEKVYDVLTEAYREGFRDESRRAKSRLMAELQERFGSYLQLSTLEHNEIRFKPLATDAPVEAVQNCLTRLYPWGTTCLGASANPLDLEGDGKFPENASFEEQEALEWHRIHADICPSCFDRLTRYSNVEPPRQMLDLPLFTISDESERKEPPPTKGGPMALSPEELKKLRESVWRQEQGRKLGSPRLLRVSVDGEDCAIIDLSKSQPEKIALPDGAEMLKVYGRMDSSLDEEVLLACHLVEYDDDVAIAEEASVLFNKKKQLKLAIVPGAAGAATVTVSYLAGDTAASVFARFGSSVRAMLAKVSPFRQQGSFFGPWVTAVLALAVCLLGFSLWRTNQEWAAFQAQGKAKVAESQRLAQSARDEFARERARSQELQHQIAELESRSNLTGYQDAHGNPPPSHSDLAGMFLLTPQVRGKVEPKVLIPPGVKVAQFGLQLRSTLSPQQLFVVTLFDSNDSEIWKTEIRTARRESLLKISVPLRLLRAGLDHFTLAEKGDQSGLSGVDFPFEVVQKQTSQ